MTERLRKRVFCSIFFSAAGVLLAILIALNALNLIQTEEKAAKILDTAAELMENVGTTAGAGKGRSARSQAKAELLRSVSEDELGLIQLSPHGKVLSVTGLSDVQAEAEDWDALAAKARSEEGGRGTWNAWRYRLGEGGQGDFLVVLDPVSLHAEARETLLISVLGFAAACVLFALLAGWLAKKITSPVERTMQGQKRFIADASHELKTPLTVIDANTAVLEKEIGPNKWLGYIQTETQRMSGLVAALLQLSELDEAKEDRRPPVRFDASETVTETALPFESLAFEQGAALDMSLPDSLPVSGYPEDLAKIAGILIENAVKHCGEGSDIRVCLAPAQSARAKGPQRAELSVQNTGETIPPEAMQHLFDRFYKLDASRKYKGQSYGLGLAIAKGIADRRGWDIRAESSGGRTVFRLTFPADA